MGTSQHGHDGEEAIQPDSLETVCPARWLTRLSAVTDLEQIVYRC